MVELGLYEPNCKLLYQIKLIRQVIVRDVIFADYVEFSRW